MQKNLFKSGVLVLSSLMIGGIIATSSTAVKVSADEIQDEQMENTNNDENNSVESDIQNNNDSDSNEKENSITINDKKYTEAEFSDLLDNAHQINDNEGAYYNPKARFAPAIGAVYFIPGIGEVAAAATGGFVIAGVTVVAGSWAYDKITEFFASEHTKNASKSSHDKHTKPRAGRDSEKKKQKDNWNKRK